MTVPLRALIVDDERLARAELRRLCSTIPALELIGECSGAREAVAAVRRGRPDILLLDIEMPGVNGFDVLELLQYDEIPAVILVTAHDKYALRAFDVHAVDYILKPAEPARLRAAIESARTRVEARDIEGRRKQLAALLHEMQGHSRRAGSIAVPSRDGIERIPLTAVDWLQAEDNYVRIHSVGKSYLLRSTLAALEKKLDAREFVRIHRSTIVSISKIARLSRLAPNHFAIVLDNGVQLRLSRAYRKGVASAFRAPFATK
jgi:two-component system, LytTR family, response regulator